jgi:hypothetical protein
MTELAEQLIGVPFEQFLWPGVWNIFKPAKNSSMGSLTEIASSYVNIIDDDLWDRASTVSSMLSVECHEPPNEFPPNDVPLYDDKFNIYRYKHELTGYSINESGDSFSTEPSKLTHWFKGVLRELTYEVSDDSTEQNFKDLGVTFDQYLWPTTGTAYGSNENGDDFSLIEDIYNKWFIASSVLISEEKPSAHIWTVNDFNVQTVDPSYTVSAIMPFIQYINDSEELRFYDNVDSAELPINEQVLGVDYFNTEQTTSMISGKLYKLFYINDFSNNSLIESSFVYEEFKTHYELTRYASDNTGSNMMTESGTVADIATHWYRIDLDVMDYIGMSNEDLLSKYSNKWQQYVTAETISVWKPYDDTENQYVVTVDPHDEDYVNGVSTVIKYLPGWLNEDIISSNIDWDDGQGSVDPYAKFRIRYTNHSNEQNPIDNMFNSIPNIGEIAERNSVSNGVKEIILTETAPSSNVWVALAKDNPNLPSDEVLSSFEAIPVFANKLKAYSDEEIPLISSQFKPCRMVYDNNPHHEKPIKAFFTDVNKCNYITYSMSDIVDAYNNVIIGDGMISRETGIPERLLKTSSYNSFFSNSIFIAGVSGANVGRDGKFVMDPSTDDYDTTNCRIVDSKYIKNDYEIIIAETEYLEGRLPYDKFSYKDEYYSELTSIFDDVVFTCDTPNMYNTEFDVYELYDSFEVLKSNFLSANGLSAANIANADKAFVIPAFRATYRVIEGNEFLSGGGDCFDCDYSLADLDKLVYDNVGLHFSDLPNGTVKHWANSTTNADNNFNLFAYIHKLNDNSYKDFITFNVKTEHYFYHLSGIVDAPTKDTYHIFGAALECYMRSDMTALTKYQITSPTSGYIENAKRQIYRIYQVNPNINSNGTNAIGVIDDN